MQNPSAKSVAAVAMDVEASAASPPVLLAEKSNFPSPTAHEISDDGIQILNISVPPQCHARLKREWVEIYTSIHDKMKIDIQMNLDSSRVELRTRPDTPDARNLQRCADCVRAFLLGFEAIDATTMLLIELRVETFELQNVKTYRGEPLARSIERLGKRWCNPRVPIENLTRTKIVIENFQIHVLGRNADDRKVAREAIEALVVVVGYPASSDERYSTLMSVLGGLSKRKFKQGQLIIKELDQRRINLVASST